MKRREFMVLASAAATWPIATRAQRPGQMRRIGVLMNLAADDPQSQAYNGAFLQGLQEFGWTVGRNILVESRYADGNADRIRNYAAELVVLAPDVIVTSTSFTMQALQQATRTIPIVFVQVVDPIGGGFAASLARPGGNATGLTVFEYGISAKWLELLKDIAPRITRVAVTRNPSSVAQVGMLGSIQSAASSRGVELRPIDVRDATEIERAIAAFARSGNGGLIVPSGQMSLARRELIVMLAARERLPAVYGDRFYVTGGGLISYDPDRIEQYRRAAGYVDRILRGEKPADLPVQAATKYDLTLNLRTARALGLDVPPALLARADRVIE
jgi:putative ABC transport system substrate-binding protein